MAFLHSCATIPSPACSSAPEVATLHHPAFCYFTSSTTSSLWQPPSTVPPPPPLWASAISAVLLSPLLAPSKAFLRATTDSEPPEIGMPMTTLVLPTSRWRRWKWKPRWPMVVPKSGHLAAFESVRFWHRRYTASVVCRRVHLRLPLLPQPPPQIPVTLVRHPLLFPPHPVSTRCASRWVVYCFSPSPSIWALRFRDLDYELLLLNYCDLKLPSTVVLIMFRQFFNLFLPGYHNWLWILLACNRRVKHW